MSITIFGKDIKYHNPSVDTLYELALERPGHAKASNGALIAMSGKCTGRSPQEKRVVEEPAFKENIWWGKINIPISEASYQKNRERALGFLKEQELIVIDAFAGWDPDQKIKVRVICTRPYHALFMWNMLIRPTSEELENFGEPEWVIYNAGVHPADPSLEGVANDVSVNLSFKNKELVILGSQYAGEMKKGIFTVLNYTLPEKNILSMHCSANEGKDGDTALFFGLSGTGKTTLSADPNRALIGDDEHGWSDKGIFNFEGGCYAKTINLSAEGEPEIYNAIKYGSVLENVGYDEQTGDVDYTDSSITENTRCSYPIEFIENAKIPCVGGHPKNVIFLTCDAFGVLPPVSKLTPGQAMYHFISGYTAKVAGTEVGITEPQATFSACFGAAFLVWHPTKYAEMLAEKMKQHNVHIWLVNTGWTGGAYGVGHRMSLKHTRSIIDAILDGSLENVEYTTDPIFGLAIPHEVNRVPSEVLNPVQTWEDQNAYQETALKLAKMYVENFKKYEDQASQETLQASPKTNVG